MEMELSVAPCPQVIKYYFKNKLRYQIIPTKTEASKADADLVTYTKVLNHPDNPIFPELAGIVVQSTVVINLTDGSIVDHYVKVNSGSPIRSYDEEPGLKQLKCIIKWHMNIISMSKEYLNGGWLNAENVKESLSRRAVKNVHIGDCKKIIKRSMPNMKEFE